MKPFTLIASGVFALIALLHVLRFALGWNVWLEGSPVPMWASLIAAIVASALSVGTWREARATQAR